MMSLDSAIATPFGCAGIAWLILRGTLDAACALGRAARKLPRTLLRLAEGSARTWHRAATPGAHAAARKAPPPAAPPPYPPWPAFMAGAAMPAHPERSMVCDFPPSADRPTQTLPVLHDGRPM